MFRNSGTLVLNTFNKGDAVPGYRPEPLWIPAGLIAGGLSGGAVGTIVLGLALALDDPGEVVVGATIGAVYGAPVGAAVGLAVGVAMTFLVGSHLGRAAARRRARTLGPAATLVALGVAVPPFLGWLSVLVLPVGVALAVPLSTWIGGFTPDEARS
ncbi:hypothetical protein NOZE110980_08630 [Nocardioides zeicaulis]